MPSFGYAAFAIAGLAAACAPLVIHLLNRRRFRVMRWAAMDFLLHATNRSRRILNLRDILLLLLRTACVLLFALALARPYFASTASDFDPTDPVHAVLVLDNSLSMGYYESNAQTLLEMAKDKGREFIKQLPENSRISVIPLFGTGMDYSRDAYSSPESAIEQLDQINVADQGVSDSVDVAQRVHDEAILAQQRLPEMAAATRVIFLGDQQKVNWDGLSSSTTDSDLGVPDIQVVDVSPVNASNTWVADLRSQEVVAVAGSTITFVATIRHIGPADSQPRQNVEVIFSADGKEGVERKYIDSLVSGAAEVVSFDYQVDRNIEGNSIAYVAAKVEIVSLEDQLQQDNARHLVVSVVPSMPVLFVDQFGAEENPAENRYGQTRRLRLLMETNQAESDSANHGIPAQHTGTTNPLQGDTTDKLLSFQQATIDQLSQEMLANKRLVVIAGVKEPTHDSVRLLQEYVRQGGQLIIAPGADFDPVSWNTIAWADGQGILPASLKSEFIGRKLDETPDKPLEMFQLNADSLSRNYFALPGNDRSVLKEVYSATPFFKAVAIDQDASKNEELIAARTQQNIERLKFLSASNLRERKWKQLEQQGELTDAQAAEREQDQEQRLAYEPRWLNWGRNQIDEELFVGEDDESIRTEAEKLLQKETVQPIAMFTNAQPFMVEQRIGRGRVVFITSDVSTDNWNNLSKSNAIVMFDWMMRSMIESTLPRRNFETAEPIELPIDAKDRGAKFVLTAPNNEPKEIEGGDLNADVYGLAIQDATDRGIYKITALESDDTPITAGAGEPGVLWQIPIAVSRPEMSYDDKSESELTPITEKGFREQTGEESPFTWVSRNGEISLQGGRIRGQNLWWWLIALVLVALLVEWLVIAWPQVVREEKQ